MNIHAKHIWSQVVFYLGWLMMVFFETTLWSVTGLVLGLAVFLGGGYGWAVCHIRNTEQGAKIHGPVLVLIERMLRRWPNLMLLPAAFLGGGPGIGLVLKSQGRSDASRRSLIASSVYALTWMSIHALRPSAGIPVEVWPSLEFLNNIRHLF